MKPGYTEDCWSWLTGVRGLGSIFFWYVFKNSNKMFQKNVVIHKDLKPQLWFFLCVFFFWLSPFISQASLQLLILSLLSLGITGMHLPLAQSCWWFSLTEVLPSLLRILISFTLCLIWSRNIPQVFMRFLSLIFKITFIYLFWVCTCVCVWVCVYTKRQGFLSMKSSEQRTRIIQTWPW